MNFKSFVPAPARLYIEDIIRGSQNSDGLEHALDKANQRLLEVSLSLQQKMKINGSLDPDDIKEKRMAEAYRDQCADDIDFLHKLGDDLRMKDAYKTMKKICTTDNQWHSFLHCCWSARINFHKYRERIKASTELSKIISEKSEALGLLMRELEGILSDLPLELRSISSLLRLTENHRLHDRDLEMWRMYRGVVLGDQLPEDIEDTRLSQRDTLIEKGVAENEKTCNEKISVSEIDQYRSNVRYAWGLAPDFASLLFKVAEIMKDFSPKEHGYIGAGVASRENNEKTAYIRALYSLLHYEHGFEMSLPVRKAIATVTTIAMDHRDTEASLDDVTKAIDFYEAKNTP